MSIRFGSNFKLNQPLSFEQLVSLRRAVPGKFVFHAPHERDGDLVTLALRRGPDHDNSEDPNQTDIAQIACPNRMDDQLAQVLEAQGIQAQRQQDVDFVEEAFAPPDGFEEERLMDRVTLAQLLEARKRYVLSWLRKD